MVKIANNKTAIGCRLRGSFATLEEGKEEFLDEGGKEGIGLLRHWKQN